MDIQRMKDKTSKPLINFEDFEIEDIPFKPINEGLGFHHSTKQNIGDLHVHKKVYENAIQKADVSTRAVPEELSAFYKAQSPKINREISIAEIREREASLLLRFSAFVIDLVVTGVFCTLMISLMFISTGLTVSQFLTQLGSFPVVLFPIVLFILIHNICVISFGFSQSLGQKIFSIKNKFNETVTVFDLCKRTQFEILSVLLFGIPYLIKLDQKLLNNKVVTI